MPQPDHLEPEGRICPQGGHSTSAAICPEHNCPTILRPVAGLDSLQAGAILAGRYRVERLLGRGGFGAVYLTTHVAMGQEQVVKVLKPDLAEDPTQVQRFFNEARASSKLSHPNTVRVFDFGQTDAGLLFLAMERLQGVELAQVLKNQQRLEPLRAIRVAVQVLKSLSEAHGAGIVHRDLKPDNIFLCKIHGEEDFVKVIDFGIAKAMGGGKDADLTRTGFAVGTPKYMSPEQVRTEPLSGKSDLYAVGVILYQCLCGEVPLQGSTAMETLMMHLQQPPQPLRERVQGLPAGLNEVVMRALRKSPLERFTDADEMRQALEAVLDEVLVRTPTGLRRAVASGRLPAVSQDDLDLRTERVDEVVKVAELKASMPSTAPQPRVVAATPPAQNTALPQAETTFLPVPTPSQASPVPDESTGAQAIDQTTKPDPTERSVPEPGRSGLNGAETRVLATGEALSGPAKATPPRRSVTPKILGIGAALLAVGLAGAWAAWRAEPAATTPEQIVTAGAAPVAAPAVAAEPSKDPGPAANDHPAAQPPATAPLPAAAPPAPAGPQAQPPAELLAAEEIAKTVVGLEAQIAACRSQRPAAGQAIALTAVVDATGAVTELLPAEGLQDGDLRACVEAAVRSVKFTVAQSPKRSALLRFEAPAAAARPSEPAPAPSRPAPERAKPRPATKTSRPAANGDEAL